MKKTEMKVVGDYTWRDARFVMVSNLENAKTEIQFIKAVKLILLGCGTLEEMKKVRKNLGVKPFTKEEIKGMKI